MLRYLQAEREHGRSQIWLSTEALIALGDLPARLNALNPPLTTETRVQEMRTDVGNPTLSAAVPASESVAREKARRLREIRMELEADAELVGMESLRDTLVFAVGNPDADLMLVGEAPGAEGGLIPEARTSEKPHLQGAA